MRRMLSLVAAIVLLFSMASAQAEASGLQLHLKIDFDKNIVMARYDADVRINGVKVATIRHGGKLDATFPVPAGLCELTFSKTEDTTIFGSILLNITENTEFACEIHANLKDIELRDVATNAELAHVRLGLGEPGVLSGLQVQVNKYTVASSLGSATAARGHVFLICEVEFHNQSTIEASVNAPLQFDACCDDYELDIKYSAMINMDSMSSLLESFGHVNEVIRPGKKLVIDVVFEVPADWQQLEIYFKRSPIALDELTFLVERK